MKIEFDVAKEFIDELFEKLNQKIAVLNFYYLLMSQKHQIPKKKC